MSNEPIFDALNAELDYTGKMEDARKATARCFPLSANSYARKAGWIAYDQTARTLLEEAPCQSEDPSAAFKCFHEDAEPETKPVSKIEINDLCLDAAGADYENVLGEFITSMRADFLRDHPYAVIEEVGIHHELDGSSKFVIKGREPVTTPHTYKPLFESKESDEE